MSEDRLLRQIESLMDEGIVNRNPCILARITIIGSAKSKRIEDIEPYLEKVADKYPRAIVVVGADSALEKEAVSAADRQGLRTEIIEKAPKGEWDAGPEIRDERVVARSHVVVCLDNSARSKAYQSLAKRQRKKIVHV